MLKSVGEIRGHQWEIILVSFWYRRARRGTCGSAETPEGVRVCMICGSAFFNVHSNNTKTNLVRPQAVLVLPAAEELALGLGGWFAVICKFSIRLYADG